MDDRVTTALAIGCHPDDIEFLMAGTLFQLKNVGINLHYFNLANGNCGSVDYGIAELEEIRQKEAQAAAAYLGATWYPSIANDLEVVYDLKLVRKVAALIRMVQPDIILVPALHDYMEDHMNTARIAVTAAFSIAMVNFITDPEVDALIKEVAIYHALPYGLHDGLSNRIHAQLFVDITREMGRKQEMLSFHTSQIKWLDDSQKVDSYIQIMEEMSEEVGRESKKFRFAEGWIRHNPLGFSSPSFSPLEKALGSDISNR